MYDYIRVQYALYKAGGQSVGLERIQKLAEAYLTAEQREAIFGGDTDV